MSHVFILGASDAEMDAIEGLLKANGYPFAHATLERRRVRAGNAYRADATRIDLASDFEPVFVECAVAGIERTHVILLTPHGERERGARQVTSLRCLPPSPSWGTGTLVFADADVVGADLLTPHGEREPARMRFAAAVMASS